MQWQELFLACKLLDKYLSNRKSVWQSVLVCGVKEWGAKGGEGEAEKGGDQVDSVNNSKHEKKSVTVQDKALQM